MANKKSKSVQQPVYISKRQAQALAAKKQKRNTIIIIAVTVAVTLAAIIGLVALALNEDVVDENGRYDYFKNRASKYVSLSSSYYKSPEITLPAYLNGDENAVEGYIEYLCNENAVSTGNKITDQPIKEGDTVAIYYEGWLNGEKFSGGSNMSNSTPTSLKIGSGTFIPGFEEGLIGLIPENTGKDNLYDLHVTFPDDYSSTDLAGKAVVFKVYIEYIDEKAPAEYTDKFIKDTLASKLGYTVPATDIKADFEKFLKDEYLPQLKKQETQNAIWDKITENAKIKGYPQGEVDYIYSTYESDYKNTYSQSGYSSYFGTFEKFMEAYFGSSWKDQFMEQSKSDVAKNLIYHYIAQKENITVSDEEYQNAVNHYIEIYSEAGQEMTAADIEYYLGESGIKEYVIAEKVNELLINNCTISYE